MKVQFENFNRLGASYCKITVTFSPMNAKALLSPQFHRWSSCFEPTERQTVLFLSLASWLSLYRVYSQLCLFRPWKGDCRAEMILISVSLMALSLVNYYFAIIVLLISRSISVSGFIFSGLGRKPALLSVSETQFIA